ncbi:TatD family hydrolase [Deinococcus sonorensis]|uniref:TatD family hydrolase n=2 Tax=Deinococcus sonorensis TaxID=309891 RepID=A0AAU7UG09_9DEIO
MNYIDLHAHMISRSTDDYHRMALTGCLAVTEPAFWSGRDRLGALAFADYFDHLTTFEPARAQQYGIQHYAWLCLNPKEGEDRELAREVLALIPDFLDRPTVLGIGEIGLNRVTRNELATFVDHVELALEHHQLIHVHTPHLEDKYKGTRVIVETLAKDGRIDPARVMIDHAEEHTAPLILEHGFWTGFTLYPKTKASPARALDMIEMYGHERICVASACDWGPSDPVAIPEFVLEARRRGHDEAGIQRIVLHNPQAFLSQSPKFRLKLPEGTAPRALAAD